MHGARHAQMEASLCAIQRCEAEYQVELTQGAWREHDEAPLQIALELFLQHAPAIFYLGELRRQCRHLVVKPQGFRGIG
jgi:hypothetical protein